MSIRLAHRDGILSSSSMLASWVSALYHVPDSGGNSGNDSDRRLFLKVAIWFSGYFSISSGRAASGRSFSVVIISSAIPLDLELL